MKPDAATVNAAAYVAAHAARATYAAYDDNDDTDTATVNAAAYVAANAARDAYSAFSR